VLFADADQELAEQRESQQRENERRLRTQRLQGRLVQAAAEGQVWRDQAEEARAATWRLAGSLSHELKTPLSAILGYTRLLEEALSALPEQRQQVRVIEQSAEHITQLIDATLEQYRRDVTELTIHPRPTDVRELVASLTELMAPLAADKALGFAAFVAPTLPERLHTDGMRLRQVLLNLLGNAIKFTEEGWVRLDVHPQGEGLVLAVADSGPGIAPEHRERVFAAFDRAGRDETIGATGTGLGLHITQQIVARMGGTIDLESQVDRGSRFTVRVPAPVVAEADPAIRDEPVEPGRVLVAEDDLDLRVLFGVFLERAGFDTLFVTRGDEVVREGLAVPPQLVLMDLNLDGGVDGFTAAARLREGGYPGPILALSAGDAALEGRGDCGRLRRFPGEAGATRAVARTCFRLTEAPPMSLKRLLADDVEPLDLLACRTPPAWVQAAVANLPVLLIDHANCEKKAASTALSLLFRYPDNVALTHWMSRLAREELRHFEQVSKLMQRPWDTLAHGTCIALCRGPACAGASAGAGAPARHADRRGADRGAQLRAFRGDRTAPRCGTGGVLPRPVSLRAPSFPALHPPCRHRGGARRYR
jgi:signal transduction histidine kinase/CheY-like chemotaxis protein